MHQRLETCHISSPCHCCCCSHRRFDALNETKINISQFIISVIIIIKTYQRLETCRVSSPCCCQCCCHRHSNTFKLSGLWVG